MVQQFDLVRAPIDDVECRGDEHREVVPLVAALYALEVRHSGLTVGVHEEVTDVRVAVDEAVGGCVIEQAQSADRLEHGARVAIDARDCSAVRGVEELAVLVEQGDPERVRLAER